MPLWKRVLKKMKIPKTFIPDKELESKVEDLKSQKKNKIKGLKDLILWQDSEEFMRYTNILDPAFETYYKILDAKSIEEKVEVKYDDVIIHVLKFVDQNLLKENAKTIRGISSLFNKKSNYSQGNVVVKDQYAVFVYTFLGDCDTRSRFINAYKKMFGFKELKE